MGWITGAGADVELVGLIPWIVDATGVVLSAMTVSLAPAPGSLPEVKLRLTKLMAFGLVEVSAASSDTVRIQVPSSWAAVRPARLRLDRSNSSSGWKCPT